MAEGPKPENPLIILTRGLSKEEEKLRREEDRKQHEQRCHESMPRMGEVVSLETLRQPYLRIQTFAFVCSLTATIVHTLFDETYEVAVPQAKLAVWIETELKGEELSWRWLGAIYSWRSCSILPLDYCNAATQTTISRKVMPLVREWSHLIRQVDNSNSPSYDDLDGYQNSSTDSSDIRNQAMPNDTDQNKSRPSQIFRDNMEV